MNLRKIKSRLTRILPRRLRTDKMVIARRYERTFGKPINWKQPTTFNEKLQWLKIHHRDPLMTQCSDKYAVREYVRGKVGADVLNELHGVWDDVARIDFESLPDSYALKATHGCGWNVVVQNKSTLDVAATRRQLKQWLKTNYAAYAREWVYKNIPPKIICEKYLQDNAGELLDYKFFCFNGKPEFIQVDIDRYTNHTRAMFNPQWQQLDVEYTYPKTAKAIPIPPKLPEMLHTAAALSNDFPFVRVDLYNVDGRIIFGELTFYPEAGFGQFRPACWDEKFGKMLTLPK